ncbi:VWA domain-containing protein [Oscillospiraceae bacterium OttesenSCG-928-F05]|nr:VWA domain-containing protein [Oscillospiraceae bacterium OttesenSCG-928-F05]
MNKWRRAPYKTLAEVFSSGIGDSFKPTAAGTRVYKSKKLDDLMYADLRNTYDLGLDELEAEGTEKLSSYPSLTRDTFQSFYSLSPKKHDEQDMSAVTRQFNLAIMDKITQSDEYPMIKKYCEGRSVLAYEAVRDFSRQLMDNLNDLLSPENDAGAKKALDVLEHLEKRRSDLQEKMAPMLTQPEQQRDQKSLLRAANELSSVNRQAEYIANKIQKGLHSDRADAIVRGALSAAASAAQEAETVLSTWGSEEGSPKADALNYALLRRVHGSEKLRAITRQLGRLKELYTSARKSSFAYGRGDKYDIELGGNYTRALVSEYALLASPETRPLFMQKVLEKSLKQYRRRERIAKGEGDFIVCLDTSGSMQGERDDWAKAVALSIMGIATERRRSFALINFSTDVKTDVFIRDSYAPEDVFRAMEFSHHGGTDFEPPLNAAVELMETSGFEKADIVLITDGECEVSEGFRDYLAERKQALSFSVTGILIDTDGGISDFSLEPFCDKVYRLSQLDGDAVVSSLFASRM